MKSKFVLFGVPRVGSNFLISLLNQHSDIRCHFEVFSKDQVYLSWSADDLEKHPELARFKDPIVRDQNPTLFLNQLLDASDKPVSGFNIFPRQNDEIISYVCDDSDFEFIFIERRNILRSYISQKIAEKNNAWNSLNSRSLTLDDKRFAIDTCDFDAYQRRTTAFYQSVKSRLDSRGERYHVVQYEKLAVDRAEVNLCYQFLGLPAAAGISETVFKKENREKVEQIIVNYSELTDYCAARGLDSWLEC